ncbi:MAG: HepT-like ribonuclease domain-containing protein [Bacillota bacterium]
MKEKQDAVIRRLTIIGEAVKSISPELKRECPAIPWQKITGMRNILIHEYFGVDVELTWKTVQRDLPVLKRELLNILKTAGEP